MIAANLTREIGDAGRGVARLIRYDPRWVDGFDPSASGFLRSFVGPLLSLPFMAVASALLSAAETEGHIINPHDVWSEVIGQLLATVAYPAVLGALAKPFSLGAGYSAFIVVVNWLTLYAILATVAAGAVLPFGGGDLFRFASMIIFGVALFGIWRAARETLSADVAPALLAVVLWVALGAVCDQLGDWLGGARPG